MDRLEYSLTNDDYLAFNRYAATHHTTIGAYARRVRVNGTVAAGLLALIVFWLVSQDPFLTAITTILAAGVMWMLWPWAQRRAIDSQLNKLAKTGDLGRLGDTVLTWDDSGLTESAAASQAIVGWERVRRVEETASHVFIFLGELEALIVPKRAGAGVAELVRAAQARRAAREQEPGSAGS